jgi:hypothetical protein
MLETPLWFKIVFAVWVVAFIFLEAAWDSIWDWLKGKLRSSIRGMGNPPPRLKRKAG